MAYAATKTLVIQQIKISPLVILRASTLVQEERLASMFLPVCHKRQLNGGWWTFGTKSIPAQDVTDNVLLQSMVRSAALASLKDKWKHPEWYSSYHPPSADWSIKRCTVRLMVQGRSLTLQTSCPWCSLAYGRLIFGVPSINSNNMSTYDVLEQLF